jgi:phosphopantothenoylcysteine decarboxylase/phosphopantothenate--cysteine ligase
MLDPVRFLSNLSTGEMGYALARIAHSRKNKVTLISGPTVLKNPRGVQFVPVISAHEMKRACERYFPRHDILIMTAAVCDFTAHVPRRHKIHRTQTKRLLLKQTPDIVAGLAKKKGKRLVVGFCLETRDWIKNAKRKLKTKNLDGIVANYCGPAQTPFGNRRITAAFINRRGETELLFRQSKRQIAHRLLEWIEKLL